MGRTTNLRQEKRSYFHFNIENKFPRERRWGHVLLWQLDLDPQLHSCQEKLHKNHLQVWPTHVLLDMGNHRAGCPAWVSPCAVSWSLYEDIIDSAQWALTWHQQLWSKLYHFPLNSTVRKLWKYRVDGSEKKSICLLFYCRDREV